MSGFEWLPDREVLVGSATIGAVSGALGCFAVLRRQSMLADTLAHAALPGVCLAFLLTGGLKDPLMLLLGAGAAGILGTLLVIGIVRGSRLKQDAALGVVLTTFFGIGIVLLRFIQDRPGGNQSGLKHFIYGQVGFITQDQVVLMLIFGSVVLVLVALFYKEFKLLSFDPEYGSTLGYPRRWLDILFAMLLVTTVMISLRAVGVVLTVALLIAPGAAARQWTHRLSRMILLAMLIGVLSSLGGALWSKHSRVNMPAGPAIVLIASGFVIVSLLLAPRRGLLWAWLRMARHRRTVRRENLLTDFYRLGERARDWERPRNPRELAAVRSQAPRPVQRTLGDLRGEGYVEPSDSGWRLTPSGLVEAARVVRNHRLWELYLARRLELAADHVHRDAEEMEHALPPEIVAELEATLDHPDLDPHGLPIPRATVGA